MYIHAASGLFDVTPEWSSAEHTNQLFQVIFYTSLVTNQKHQHSQPEELYRFLKIICRKRNSYTSHQHLVFSQLKWLNIYIGIFKSVLYRPTSVQGNNPQIITYLMQPRPYQAFL